MSKFRKQVNQIIDGLINNFTRREVERFNSRSFAVFDKKRRGEAWFSYRAQIRSLIEKSNIDMVIDAGANEGQFARQLRSIYAGPILSFEPVSTVFEKLAVNSADDSNWHAYKLALGSQRSTQAINISDATVFSSLLKTNDYCSEQFGDRSRSKREEIVSIERLDDFLEKFSPTAVNQRIFLKMDTQGFDMEVFKGLGEKLKQVVAIQSEVSLISIYEGMPHWTESISAYEKAGFGVIGMFPVTWDAGRVVEYDCLMSRITS